MAVFLEYFYIYMIAFSELLYSVPSHSTPAAIKHYYFNKKRQLWQSLLHLSKTKRGNVMQVVLILHQL